MQGFEYIVSFFPELDPTQLEQLRRMGDLYAEWNEKINVISRKDIDNLFTAHVLHSLVIARFLGPLTPGTTIMDLGTGGGFPGIPLAVAFPQARFHLIDRIGKKLRVAQAVAADLGLSNVSLQHGDSGECHDRFDYVVSRAVMPLDRLVKAVSRNISRHPRHGNAYAPGLVCLKGGDLAAESADVRFPVIEYSVQEFVNLPAFDTKKLVYVPM